MTLLHPIQPEEKPKSQSKAKSKPSSKPKSRPSESSENKEDSRRRKSEGNVKSKSKPRSSRTDEPLKTSQSTSVLLPPRSRSPGSHPQPHLALLIPLPQATLPVAYGLPLQLNVPWASTTQLRPVTAPQRDHPGASSSRPTTQRPPITRLGKSAHVVPQASRSATDLGTLSHGVSQITLELGADEAENRMSILLTALDNDEDEDINANKQYTAPPIRGLRGGEASRSNTHLPGPSCGGVFQTAYSKVWFYTNSRLPPHLPPLMIYFPTYPLFCLAARYSLSVYNTTASKPTEAQPTSNRTATIRIPPSARLGTKAMSLSLAPSICSSTPTLVLAIRGSTTFSDWAVNFRPSPAAPTALLDDPGNLVHSGFLAVARSMLDPTADQLARFLASVDARDWRAQGQLLLCGHSAGGAVASLLFAHVLARSDGVQSRLRTLVGRAFKRVHCVTFGAPPITLLPLEKPALPPPEGGPRDEGREMEAHRRWRKNLFFSIVNEGDPVVRAEPAVVRNLLELYARPAPGVGKAWAVPENRYSNAGRIVVVRQVAPPGGRLRGFLGLGRKKEGEAEEGNIEAVVATDEQLRGVVYGDPMMHSMRLYKKRMDVLALAAMTGE